jgi:hypothetical protein
MDLYDLVDEPELLNAAGDDGWELIASTVNRIGCLMRQIEDDPAHALRTSSRPPRQRARDHAKA